MIMRENNTLPFRVILQSANFAAEILFFIAKFAKLKTQKKRQDENANNLCSIYYSKFTLIYGFFISFFFCSKSQT